MVYITHFESKRALAIVTRAGARKGSVTQAALRPPGRPIVTCVTGFIASRHHIIAHLKRLPESNSRPS